MDAVPFFERRMFGVMRAGAVFKTGDARIIDDYVHCRVGERKLVPIGFGRDVEFEECGAERFCQRFACIDVDIGDDSDGTFGDECFSNSSTDSARSPSDEGRFIL